jgi:hypothetical protein
VGAPCNGCPRSYPLVKKQIQDENTLAEFLVRTVFHALFAHPFNMYGNLNIWALPDEK